MSTQRRVYNADFKAKVAVVVIRGQHTVNEIASQYGIHPNQVMTWKKQALEAIPECFRRGGRRTSLVSVYRRASPDWAQARFPLPPLSASGCRGLCGPPAV